MILFIKVFLLLTVAFLAGIIFWKSLSIFLKIIVVQLGLGIAAQTWGAVYGMNNLSLNNLGYNLYITLEVCLLAGANAIYLNRLKDRIIIATGLICFGAAMVTDFSRKTAFAFSDHAYIVECLLLVLLYLMLLTREVIAKIEKITRSPLFWIGIGSILYFGCNIPYFSMRPYFEKTNSKLTTSLFILNKILLNFRYLFVLIAFLLQRKQSHRKI